MKKTLYIFTTESDRKKGQYKFGETINEADSRIKNLQTGNSEDLIRVGKFTSEYSDHYVHNELEKLGYSRVVTGGREWFKNFKSDDEALATLGRIVSTSDSVDLQEYTPYFYQDLVKMYFEDKLKKVEGSKNEFALELAPRFGKTLWTLDLMVTLFNEYNYKVAMLPAYVLTALSSFEKEFYLFKGFKDTMIFVREGDDVKKIFEQYYGKKMIILPISLHTEDYQSKFEYLTKLPMVEKVSFIDEADFGYHRDNSQTFIKYLNCGLDVYMTGTAIDKVVSPLDNIGDNIIRWSYTDMLMVQNGEHPIQKIFV
jgi:hypothetical protein